MSVKVREQRGKLYLDIYQGGVRRWESLHITLSDDKKQNKELYRLAEVCRAKREAQLLAGEWSIKTDDAGRTTLLSYLKKHAAGLASPSSANALAHHLEGYTGGATIQMGQVTSKWVEDFQAYLLKYTKQNGKPISRSTVATYMGQLCRVFHKAVSDGMISRNPTTTVSLARAEAPNMVFLDADEIRKLASVIPDEARGQEVRRAFLFACFTGLRISDLKTLEWSMIERNPPQIIKRQEKTKNSVYVPLNKSAQSLIFDDKPHLPEDAVFDLVVRRSSYRILEKWAKEAGVTKKIGWHTARRTFATLTLKHGADAVTVARLLGHTGLGQVMQYAKATDEMRRKAVDALPELV